MGTLLAYMGYSRHQQTLRCDEKPGTRPDARCHTLVAVEPLLRVGLEHINKAFSPDNEEAMRRGVIKSVIAV